MIFSALSVGFFCRMMRAIGITALLAGVQYSSASYYQRFEEEWQRVRHTYPWYNGHNSGRGHNQRVLRYDSYGHPTSASDEGYEYEYDRKSDEDSSEYRRLQVV